MQFVIPALLQTNALLDSMGEPRLPTLDLLLARGQTTTFQRADLSEWLCHELGIPKQHDFPIAAICLAMENNNPGKTSWLRADPVHVRITRDKLILGEITDLTQAETSELARALSEHFGNDFSPILLQSGAWVVPATGHANIFTTPLPRAIGQHIDPLLPSGADAMHWKKLLNEIQMLLFAHPVNQAREAKGLSTANSIWLWGGGHLPATPDRANVSTLMASHPLAQTLAKFAQAPLHPMQPAWTTDLQANLLVFDAPQIALLRGDFAIWLDAMKSLEQHWLKPLFDNQRSFTLCDPAQGVTLQWKNIYRWKFWRRTQKARQQVFYPDPGEPIIYSSNNVDEFGNRY